MSHKFANSLFPNWCLFLSICCGGWIVKTTLLLRILKCFFRPCHNTIPLRWLALTYCWKLWEIIIWNVWARPSVKSCSLCCCRRLASGWCNIFCCLLSYRMFFRENTYFWRTNCRIILCMMRLIYIDWFACWAFFKSFNLKILFTTLIGLMLQIISRSLGSKTLEIVV